MTSVIWKHLDVFSCFLSTALSVPLLIPLFSIFLILNSQGLARMLTSERMDIIIAFLTQTDFLASIYFF